jgi:protein-S-isoprenylcysteine O-methyltransferase Ste14
LLLIDHRVSERSFHHDLLIGWCVVAVATVPYLFFWSAPYGRHAREGWGPRIHRTVGWVVMESPSAIGFVVLYAIAPRRPGLVALVFLGLWELHYVNRAFIFPFRMRGGQKQMPLAVAASAVAFNCGNVYLNARWLSALGPEYPTSWLADPRFLVGAALFAAGFAINYHADAVLRGLRRDAGAGYQIPRGGLYRFISCPNYFGELIEWSGWALLTWSFAGATFALWTAANLVPRAITHHKWYRAQFPDYPPERKAILPLLW